MPLTSLNLFEDDDVFAPDLAPAPAPAPVHVPAHVHAPAPVQPVVPRPLPVAPTLPAAVPAAPTAPVVPAKPPVQMRRFDDFDAIRTNVYDGVVKALQEHSEVANDRYTLRLTQPEYIDPETRSKKEQKEAILAGRTLNRRIRGTWELVDNATQEVVSRKRSVVASVPYLTERGTFIHGGTDYGLRNQQRLEAGAFARRKNNGEIEMHVNTLPGKGLSHRYLLDPAKGVFKIQVGQSEMPLLPLLKAMGATSQQLQDAWGRKLTASNYAKDDASTLKKLQQRLLRKDDLGDDETSRQALIRRFESMELDPEISQRTLGKPHAGLNLEAVLDVTRKLLAVSNHEQEPDDRDSLFNQRMFGPEDLFPERIAKDSGRARKNLLWKATQKGNLDWMPSSALTTQLEDALLRSGLGMPLEEINAAETLDRAFSTTRLGEGGIPSMEGVPDESRSVQPSQVGFVDLVRTPESSRIGIDLYLAANAKKGDDGRLYAAVKDPRTGQLEWKNPRQLANAVLGFPGSLNSGRSHVPVLVDGQLQRRKRRDVDYVLPDFSASAFSPLANLIPMAANARAHRMAMGARMLTQALPLAEPQAPLVQAGMPGSGGSRSYEEEYAKHMGAVRAKQGGQVLDVANGAIKVRYDDGVEDEIELYDNFPYNRKTFVHQTSIMQPGQRFEPNQLLARSNFTDDRGVTALGRNARVAYMSFRGANFEDAIVVSEAFAKQFRADAMYQHDLDVDDKTVLGRHKFLQLYPGKFDKAALATLDDDGLVKPGTEVSYGSPLILAAKRREASHAKLHKQKQAGWNDVSVTWEHEDPGIVTDVVRGKHGPVVVVKATLPMRIGDKMSNRYGGKGVVAEIVPDDRMPHDSQGRPFEVLLNPLGIISRGNPSQVVETVLGKIAEKTGQPFKVEDFDTRRDLVQWAREQLQEHGLTDTEQVVDPDKNRKIDGILAGNQFFVRLHHLAESKDDARAGGGYSTEEAPAKGSGPGGGSKRVALLSTNALLSHGAFETLRDVGVTRGQRDDDFRYRFMSGYDPPANKVPMAYRKFVDQLKSSGINVVRRGTQTHIMALTDNDVAELAGDREIQNGETVDWGRGMAPVRGGLFDPQLTGGPNGKRWSAIKLSQPLPNPVMEEPIRRLLDLTRPQFEEVLTGQRSVGQFGSGPNGLRQALNAIDVDRELETSRARIQLGNAGERDRAIRKLGYLKAAKQLDVHPRDWVLSRVPVLPPAFRPVTQMGGGMPLVADANYLYRDLLAADENLREMQKHVGDVGAEQLALYSAFKAVTGLGDPVGRKSQEKKVRGALQQVFGTSPKFGTVQRKLLSTTVDDVGRAAITPDGSLDMDSVGLPEATAFDVYGKFVARRLKRQGLPLTHALRHLRDRSPLAKKALLAEMEERPVYIDRAPVLHKFGIMAFRPTLTAGHTMRISPLVVKGFGADFDGDTMNFHVPTSKEAVQEALDKMLPSRSLLSPADFKTPMAVPGQEYAGGLYAATNPASASKRSPRTFASKKDLRAAVARGDVGLTDRVVVLED